MKSYQTIEKDGNAMNHLTDDEKVALENALNPIREKIRKVRQDIAGCSNDYMVRSGQQQIDQYKREMKRIQESFGIFLDYSCISDNDGYRDPGERKQWSIIGALGNIPVPARYDDGGAYEIDEWLKHIGAIRKNVKCDHEYSCTYYYFSSEKSARGFIDRINKKLHELQKKHLI